MSQKHIITANSCSAAVWQAQRHGRKVNKIVISNVITIAIKKMNGSSINVQRSILVTITTTITINITHHALQPEQATTPGPALLVESDSKEGGGGGRVSAHGKSQASHVTNAKHHESHM